MPKFYGQNKKRINPRHFLEETSDRDAQLAPGAAKSDVMLAQTMRDLEPGHDSGPNFQPSKDTPFREQMPS